MNVNVNMLVSIVHKHEQIICDMTPQESHDPRDSHDPQESHGPLSRTSYYKIDHQVTTIVHTIT